MVKKYRDSAPNFCWVTNDVYSELTKILANIQYVPRKRVEGMLFGIYVHWGITDIRSKN